MTGPKKWPTTLKMKRIQLIASETQNEQIHLSNTSFSRTIYCHFKSMYFGASLVAQWLRICLLMQGTRVRALVWEDPTCRGAAGPVNQTTEPARLEPVPRNGRGRDSERPAHRDEERSPHRDEEWPPTCRN